jgi:acetyl esterase
MVGDRLNPALRQFAAARTDLSASVLGVARDSLNQRRAETTRDVNTIAVEIENREAGSTPVRIYRGASAPAPAVIYCPAGAFVLGNLDTDHRQCVEFARRGRCTVISVDYRLAPENPYPAGLDDAAAALAWAVANGANLGIDPTRLAVAGSSAGAALAALLAQRAAHGAAPPIVFALLHQPVLDDRPTPSKDEFGTTPGLDGPAAAQMSQHYLADEAAPAEAVPARTEELAGCGKHLDHVFGA